MRILFVIFLIIHGLIHLLGFIKAFGIAEIKDLTQLISKPLGLLWLLTTLLFLGTSLLFAVKYDNYWTIGFLAIVISQALIFYFWKDTKFGTLPNVIIAIICIIGFGEFSFKNMVRNEVDHLVKLANENISDILTEQKIANLPCAVQKWLKCSGMINRHEIKSVYLKQKAFVKMSPEQVQWKSAVAEQYFTTQSPSFVWTLRSKIFPLVEVVERDKFQDGKGEMLIKILSIFPVSEYKNNEKINIVTIQRYLAEIVWFPSAVISPYIKWESINDSSAKATITYKGITSSGIFFFDLSGCFKKFSAMRFMSGEEDAQLKEWIIEVKETEVRNGIKIPTKMTATWKLDTGDWTWLLLEIMDVSYDML